MGTLGVARARRGVCEKETFVVRAVVVLSDTEFTILLLPLVWCMRRTTVNRVSGYRDAGGGRKTRCCATWQEGYTQRPVIIIINTPFGHFYAYWRFAFSSRFCFFFPSSSYNNYKRVKIK